MDLKCVIYYEGWFREETIYFRWLKSFPVDSTFHKPTCGVPWGLSPERPPSGNAPSTRQKDQSWGTRFLHAAGAAHQHWNSGPTTPATALPGGTGRQDPGGEPQRAPRVHQTKPRSPPNPGSQMGLTAQAAPNPRVRHSLEKKPCIPLALGGLLETVPSCEVRLSSDFQPS